MIEKIENTLKSPDLKYETWKRDYESVKKQLFWEENNNLIDYVNAHLDFCGKELCL